MITRLNTAKIIVLYMLFFSAQPKSFSQMDARLLRSPDVSETQIVFSYAADLWIVPKSGGTARHLTSPKGQEIKPRFSPNGQLIAFSGNYDGNTDLYVIPEKGGIPERITHHPAPDVMIDWYSDNKTILYKSKMGCANNRTYRFYKTTKNGGFPEQLPLKIGEEASISPDGKYLAINMMPIVYGGAWKRYRGGAASEIWTFNLSTFEAENISNFEGDDRSPMWHGEKIYFMSDRDANKKANLWVYHTKTKEIRQLTFFTEHDIHNPAKGPKDIVFENGGKLYLLNFATEKITEVLVKIEFNDISLKPKKENVADLLRNIKLSPSGKRVVVEARGELFSLPTENGAILNLTNSSGVAERYPAWSPDGKYLAYFTDKKGEYQLALRDKNGKEKIVSDYGKGYRFQPFWSPDSKKLVFANDKMEINLYDLASGKTSVIDKGLWMDYYGLSAFHVNWSQDSKWVTWSRGQKNKNNGIFIYNVEKAKLHTVSSGFYDDFDPVFDKEGKYLFYFSKRSFNSYTSDIQPTWIYANTTNVIAVTLTKEIASPLKVENDEENAAKDKQVVKNPGFAIDFDDMEERSVILPIEAGNYSTINTVTGKITYIRRARTGASTKGKSLYFYDLKERKESLIIKGLQSYIISALDNKLLVNIKKGKFASIEVAPNQQCKKYVPVGDIEMLVDPKEEWMQMYNEAWKYMRDFFYDENMHGIDWDKIGKRYRALVPMAGSREDFNFILTQMVGEVGSGHVGVRGGAVETPEHRGVGLLGVDFSLENGAFRIKKIYNSGHREAEFRSPLSEPGINIKEGDYVLAVNGIRLSATKDPWFYFDGLAEKTVELTINSSPNYKESRKIIVKTLGHDVRLRELDWVRENREKVLKASNGQIGYIYVPNTSRIGQQDITRQFKAQFTMKGLIIDERFNGGGALGDRFVELLKRPLYGYLAVRNGRHFHMPEIAHPGPMTLLTNGWAASGGDGFPYFFQKAGLGPTIGQATMGALVGPNQYIPLLDGGIISAPPSRIYNMKGEWDGAQTGVIPDIKLINDPQSLAKGKDLQLDKAIEVILKDLKGLKSQKPNPQPLDNKWR